MKPKKENWSMIEYRQERIPQSLIDDLLETGVFNSPVDEELSDEVQKMLKTL